MATAPSTITSLPTPPSSTDMSSFDTRADALLGALPTFVSEVNAVADNVYDNAVEAAATVSAAAAEAGAAAASASAAATSQLIAEGAANYKGTYSAGTTYTVGQSVTYSGSQYVAKKTNLGITPVDGSDWLQLTAGGGGGTVTSIATANGVTGGTITNTGTIELTGQALALHNLASNGVIARTGSGTMAARTITAGTGITVSNGDGVSGNPTIAVTSSTYQPLDSDLTAIAALSSNGMIARTSTGAAQVRTITGGAGIAVTNGDGVSGNPTIATSGAVTSAGFTMATAKLLGRSTAATGAIEEITVGAGLTLSGGSLTAGSGAVYITEATASSSATLDFTDLTAYTHYLFVFDKIKPATDAVSLYFRVSTNNGSSYLATGVYSSGSLTGQTQVTLTQGGTISSSADGLTGTVWLFSPYVSAATWVISQFTGRSTSSVTPDSAGGGKHETAAQVNAVRFLMSSGNIASGKIRVYGVQ